MHLFRLLGKVFHLRGLCLLQLLNCRFQLGDFLSMVGSHLFRSKAHVFESLCVAELERSELVEGFFFGGSLFLGLVLEGLKDSLLGGRALFQLILQLLVLHLLKFNFLLTDGQFLL